MTWLEHWRLRQDPFLGPARGYVPTPTHDEVVARIAASIEAGERLVVLSGGDGVGKTTTLDRALAETKQPARRVARVVRPADGFGMSSTLAKGLGAGASRAAAWQALSDAVRVSHWQRLHPILVVDGADEVDRRDLRRLVNLAPDSPAKLTVILVVREDDPHSPDWRLLVRLQSLTVSESAAYLAAKLAAAGRSEATFTPRACQRLHSLSSGVPRGLDRLASLSLAAGASRGLELVTPDVVDGVRFECTRGSELLGSRGGIRPPAVSTRSPDWPNASRLC